MNEDRYLVIGTGISGVCAAELLKAKGKDVVLFDANTELDKNAFYAKNPSLKDIPLVTGSLPEEEMGSFGTAVLSPGVPLDQPLVQELKKSKTKISGEIELAYQNAKGRLCAVTGTNGKTTTVSLIGEILKLFYKDVRVVGNIGNPYTAEVLSMTEATVTDAEISSFQLETADTFHPNVAAILNITPDHMNRHHTMEEYSRVKEMITMNQTADDVLVLNYEDDILRSFGAHVKASVTWFSSKRELENGYFVKDRVIYRAIGGKAREFMPVSDLLIIGPHNWENAMAAMAVCEAMGVPKAVIKEGCRNFHAVEHRIEYVCTKNGVKFYNDSKGTNPDAAIKAVESMDAPTCLIGGGYDKGSTYDEWIASFKGRIKKLVLIGQTRDKIAECCRKNGFMSFETADTLEEAVDICVESAVPGDNILLSPACASWDMFKNYEVRGQIFKEYVRSLPGDDK